MKDPEQHPPIEAQRFVDERYGRRAGKLTLLGAGEWSHAYAFDLDDNPAVVRFGEYGEDFAKDKMMSRHASSELPIPAVLDLGQTSEGYFAVSERRYGKFLDALSGEEMRAVLPQLLGALDALRDISTSDYSGFGLWAASGEGTHRSWAESLLDISSEQARVHGWRDAMSGSQTSTRPFDECLKVLGSQVHQLPNVRHIIHGDLLNRNILVERGEVSAVFDWGNSEYGDYLYDAAWLLYWQSWYPKWSAVDLRGVLDNHWRTANTVPPNLDLRLLCYQIHIGLGAMRYNAFKGRFDELAVNAEQTLKLSRQLQ